MTLRRHHCRRCGKVFCHECSKNAIPLPVFGYKKPQRVCNTCFSSRVSSLSRSGIYANIMMQKEANTGSRSDSTDTPTMTDTSFLDDYGVVTHTDEDTISASAFPSDSPYGHPARDINDFRTFSIADLTHAIEDRYDLYYSTHGDISDGSELEIKEADDDFSDDSANTLSSTSTASNMSASAGATNAKQPNVAAAAAASTDSINSSLDLSSWEKLPNTVIPLRVMILLVGSHGDVQVCWASDQVSDRTNSLLTIRHDTITMLSLCHRRHYCCCNSRLSPLHKD
jgi:hypothetical protein